MQHITPWPQMEQSPEHQSTLRYSTLCTPARAQCTRVFLEQSAPESGCKKAPSDLSSEKQAGVEQRHREEEPPLSLPLLYTLHTAHSAHSAQHIAFVLCSMLDALCTVHCLLPDALCTLHCPLLNALCTVFLWMHYLLCTVHYLLSDCTLHSALSPAKCTVHS